MDISCINIGLNIIIITTVFIEGVQLAKAVFRANMFLILKKSQIIALEN